MMELERKACQKRLRDLGEKQVLLVQDTTDFYFKKAVPKADLEPAERSFLAHTSLAVSLKGLPIGLLEQKVWQRPAPEEKKANAHQNLPIEQKESYKWLAGLESSLETDTDMEYITVCDREADVYELFQLAENRGAKFIIRACKNRRLEESGLLFEALKAFPVQRQFEIEVASRRGAESRLAKVELRFGSLRLLPPKNRSAQNRSFPLEPLGLQVIEITEVEVAQGTEAIHWILLTNLVVADAQAAYQILRYYSYRWLVERFHYVLKSGCEFESSQLTTYEALQRLLGLCSTVAWRLLSMTYQARLSPNASSESLLSASEWQALTAYMSKSSEIPKTAPSLRQAVRWIGQLGGFIGRKSDGEPGVKVLWRGWEVFQTIHAAWLIFHPPQNPHPS